MGVQLAAAPPYVSHLSGTERRRIEARLRHLVDKPSYRAWYLTLAQQALLRRPGREVIAVAALVAWALVCAAYAGLALAVDAVSWSG